ncbi:MAG: Gfo/Idh/MocA family protein [Acidimicrobiales bacterium]
MLADTTMNVGVLGGGAMAARHLRSLAAVPGVRVLGLAAPEIDDYTMALCDRHQVPVHTDPNRIFDDDHGIAKLDAVVIATPTDTHAELIEMSANAAVHVFCEKPLDRTTLRAQQSMRICEAAEIKLAVGHVVRYFQSYSYIRKAVSTGKIGHPGMAKCRRVSGPPGASRAWYRNDDRSGGVLMDMGVHDFDWLRWCLGPVERVSALVSPTERGPVAMATLAHRSGAISTVDVCWMDPGGFATAVEVSGTEGLIRHDSKSAATFGIELWPSGEAPLASVEVPVGDDGYDPYLEEIKDVLSWIAGGSAPRVGVGDAVAAIALAEAANLSARERRVVDMKEFAPEVQM